MIVGGTFVNLQLSKAYERTKESLTLAQTNLEQAQDAVDRMLTEAGVDRLAPIPESDAIRRRMLETALAVCQSLTEGNPDDPASAFPTSAGPAPDGRYSSTAG